MDPIQRIDGLVELLRRRLAEAPARTASRSQPASTQASSALSGRASVEALRASIGRSIEAIDADDPDRNGKIAHLFARHVLLWQFGDQIANDPRFFSLVDDVQAGLQRDPEFAEKLALATGRESK